jgi:very-short-patch-repair endonuclease
MATKLQARPDELVSQRAAGEWSVLSLVELAECGLSPDLVKSRVRKGWLHSLHRGVYAVGHAAVPLEGRLLAAVKALGGDAALSHFAAAALWEFVDWDGRHPEVVVPRNGIGHRKGIRVHCTAVLDPGDVTRHKGIPVTSPARTLVDLAAVVNEKLLRSAVRRALAKRRVSVRHLVATRRRLGRRRGSTRVDRVLRTAAPTRTELEDVVYDLIVDAGFPRPDVNRPLLLAGRRVIPDFRWPEHRVVVEADGRKWHDNPLARADDAERQALLEAHGERVIRITWAQATAKSRQAVARLEAAGVPGRDAALGASSAGRRVSSVRLSGGRDRAELREHLVGGRLPGADSAVHVAGPAGR